MGHHTAHVLVVGREWFALFAFAAIVCVVPAALARRIKPMSSWTCPVKRVMLLAPPTVVMVMNTSQIAQVRRAGPSAGALRLGGRRGRAGRSPRSYVRGAGGYRSCSTSSS